ncbi:MAG: M14 family metallopeptidase [Ignavibacteriaceae bacterium]|nr:M14 family metallopeptidase [Ignavibacteriaceae bacterium]
MKKLSILLVVIFTSSLLLSQSQKWLTPFELSDGKSTAGYGETIEYLKNLTVHTPYARLTVLGKSPQGRDIYCFMVSRDTLFTPADARKNGKTVVLIINGIHSGEIEGKDATLLLLRDLLVDNKNQHLLDDIVLLVVPVFNIDGHERISPYNRINQDGPDNMGFRTNALNLNLNRDWVKADAPEMRLVLKLFSDWLPDFMVDNHTTDGADYQYTVTYGLERHGNIHPLIARVVDSLFIPHLKARVEGDGYLIAPYVTLRDEIDKGMLDYASTPRFSGGYAAVQNRISLLVETHMIKPFRERVYATKSVLEAVLSFVTGTGKNIREWNKEADSLTAISYGINKKYLPVAFTTADTFDKYFDFRGFEYQKVYSEFSGAEKIVYTDKPFTKKIPFYDIVKAVDSVKPPSAYIIPPQYISLASVLRLHGVKIDTIDYPTEFEVTRYRFRDVKFAERPYEGRNRASYKYDEFSERVTVPAGSLIAKTNQRAVRVLMTALEPKSGDSFVSWGLMNAIFERKEYFEDYVMEKLIPDMVKENPELMKEFNKKLAEDEKFAKDPYGRLNFFYERSPYFDKNYNLYPIMRVE